MKTKNILRNLTLVVVTGLIYTGCKKDKTPAPATAAPTSSQIISSFCTDVAIPDYSALLSNALAFQTAANSFNSNPNDNDLASMRQYWKNMRAAYETAEAFLIGPISTLNLDPNIDTWPVEKNTLDSLLAADSVFTPSFMTSLPQTLTGFHPIEYLIFGSTGTATAASFTTSKKNYLVALTNHIVDNITLIRSAYTVGSSDDFISIMENPGVSNSTYQSHKAVLLNLVNAMSDICNEVGGSASDGKIYSVYSTQNSALQESYFSNNSWADFTNNITGVRNVYLGTYGGTTPAANSLYNLVASKNLSLNNTIMTSINNAIGSFSTVGNTPFGQSVVSQRTQVLTIMNAIDSLQNTLDNKLIPFINQYVTD
jgi:predicted lipoprotein